MERRLTRFLTLLVSLLVLVSVCTTTVFAAEIKTSDDPKCYVHGDVNGDGKVGTQDAIYTLYYAMWHDVDETLYPIINQEFDFTGDGKVSTKDALHVLWASMDDEEYKLQGDIHEYYEPQWNWIDSEEGPTATLTFRCGCYSPRDTDVTDKLIVLGAADGVEISSDTTAATCVAPGKVEYTAKITYLGKEYTTDKPYVKEIPAAADGHNMVGTQGCETESVCSLCGHTLPALGHSWVLSEDEEKTFAATCTTEGQQWYDCACGEHYVVETDKVPHTHAFAGTGEPVLKEGTTCTYVTTNTYRCVCGDEITQNTEYDKHTYKAIVTKEATCIAAGVKSYVCEYCDHENGQTEQIPVNADAHKWDEGVLDEATGITTHTCSVCGGTKTAVTVAKNQEISKDQLSNELQLENANVSLDEQTVAGLDADKSIQISVEPANKEDVSLTEEQKAQVADSTIYDFNMVYNDGEPVTNFDGYVTVSLPYTLKEGDDIDAIDIWYIDNNGNLAEEPMRGVYSNGYVTFKTNHFSYYTVTRLTPAERCARYGHIWIAAEKAATCTEEGYTKDVCQRCGSEANAVAIPALDHAYTDASDAAAATCTEAGLKHQICDRCFHEVEEELPALGHNLVKDEQNSYEPDCYKPGKQTQSCDRCDYTSVEELPQLKHSFENYPEEEEYPTCTSSGKKHQKCDFCGEKIKLEESVPLGHDYGVVAWHWNEDRTSATVDLECKNDPGHTQNFKVVVSLDKEKSKPATCATNGYLVFTATATFNKSVFTDSVYVEQPATGHQTSGDWLTSDTDHHRICSVCGEKADLADHTWNESVTKEPTCSEPGAHESTCIICGYNAAGMIPPTGQHDLVGGECVDCGFKQDSCEHVKMNTKPLDLTGYDICDGAEFYVASCECGENQALYAQNIGCEWAEETPATKTLADGTVIDVSCMTCTKCGLTIEYCPQFLSVDEEICRGYYSEYFRLSLDGQTIKETVFVNRNAMFREDHPVHIVKETIDLGSLGMCGGKLVLETCSCGANVMSYYENTECEWSYANGEETCIVCGATRTYEYIGEEKDGCMIINTSTITFQLNGQTVCTYDEKYAFSSHPYEVVRYEMDGESCMDGVTVYSACRDCGFKDTIYSNMGHVSVFEEVTDLTGYGSCATASHQFTCACGVEKFGYESYNGQVANVGEQGHDFTLISEAPETGDRILLCSKCNYTCTVKYTESEKDENCNFSRITTVTYADEKGHSYSYVEAYESTEHNFEREIILKGATCDDGVEVRQVCSDCGESRIQNRYNGHMAFETQSYDLAEYGMCGGTAVLYECPCKTYAMYDIRENTCMWQWFDGNENGYTEICVNCGVTRTEKQEVLVKITDCLQRVMFTETFAKDEEELLEISFETNMYTHRDIYTFEMLNPAQGCEGGYRITSHCLTCGVEAEWGDTWYHHEAFPVAREVVSVNQLCGDLELVTYACPCGLEAWVNNEWSNGSCEFRWMNGRDVCIKCGAIRTESQTNKKVEGETCKKLSTYNINIVKNGKEICNFSYETVTTRHMEVTTFNLLGATCDDGYTYSISCVECGEFIREQTYPQYGCNSHVVEVIKVASHEDICGDVFVRVVSCACGKQKSVWSQSGDDACVFDHMGWDGITQTEKWQCRNCGLIFYRRNNQEHIKDTCTANLAFDETYELNGETIGSFQETFVVEDHRTVATFNLWGETCDDGYDVYDTCIECGRTDHWENWGHNWYQIGYYDLSDYGMCGGEISMHGCACGKEGNGWGWNYDCRWDHKGYDDATGTETYYCSECKTYRYETRVGQRDPATCTYTGVETISFIRDDVTLLTVTANYNHESHEMVADSVTLMNPEGTCEDGVITNERCVDCGYTQTRTYAYHEDITVGRVDLSDGCGGELRYGGCACGENQFFHQGYECQNMRRTDEWQEYDENNITHFFYQDECADCGLTIVRERYDIYSTTSCLVEEHENYTVTYRDQTYTHDAVWEWYSHKEQVNTGATLVNGATSCEEGVYVQWTCNYCGMSDQDRYESHQVVSGESIDLGDYGSYCGATLNLYSCACGQRQRYDIGEDSECDIHRQGTSHWIDGVINTDQDTSEGYVNTWSDAYLLKCAVSDPVACGMTIRMAEYWLNENCMAVEYQTWQLGYDEKTGTYDREITIATGEKHAYHPYETSEINENPDENTRVNGTRWTCPDCGSYAYQQWTYVNDIQTKFECSYVNTLYEINGENQSRGDFTEYGLIANGHNYETLYYWEEVAADGTARWRKDEYTNYDFSNGDCKRTRTFSDSDGYTETSIVNAHVVTCREFEDPKPTCSQDGMHYHIHDCISCGRRDYEDSWVVEPNCHDWRWDYDKQTYVCRVCELESAVGATGSICMEDLTEEDSDVYTIGYWNRENIDVIPTVSVILDDVTEDKEWVLTGIDFDYLNVKEDGVRALTFNKADAQAAAEAKIAELSYTGSFAIRISFVPTNGGNTLDYAITFDSQNTAQ